MSPAEPPHAHWLGLARHTPLGLVLDLDGTLIPFAPTPGEARPTPEVLALLTGLAALEGVAVAVVSGRSREDLASLLDAVPRLALVAEHGAWRRGEGAWQPTLEEDPRAIDRLVAELERIATAHPGVLLERKSWSVAFHVRRVESPAHDVAVVEAFAAIAAWLAEHPGFEALEGAEVIEVRPARARKSIAVAWLRDRLGPSVRLLALGDDLTDEDAFRALGPVDDAILVGDEPMRHTAARSRLAAPAEAVAFLRWIAAARSDAPTPSPGVLPRPIARPTSRMRLPGADPVDLLVVSNRLPELRQPTVPGAPRNVGGLVSALEPVLSARRGLWLGWSGRTVPGDEPDPVRVDDGGRPRLAWIDLPQRWRRDYYDGFCNRTLWPLLHSFPERMRLDDGEWACYQAANRAFAAAAAGPTGIDATIWVHDYHLFLLARHLRAHGHHGPLGFFLHVPWPGADLFGLLPWAEELLDALLEFDLIGFHTAGFVENFRQCVGALSPGRVADDAVLHRGRRTRIGAFPLGIMPEAFRPPREDDPSEEVLALLQATRGTRLVLGVDRLDYTKGIPERLLAFGRLLELFPEWRSKVSLLQLSVPSRADVPEYSEQRSRIESIVGRVNGEFGEVHWVPIRYLYRSYRQDQLARLYRAADVGYVTPLRDGMNLVAKEYVAAQDPADPGALLLSRFAGAAVELSDAILCNPWHVDGLARDLDRALRSTLEERQASHRKLLAVVSRTTALDWGESFLSALNACR